MSDQQTTTTTLTAVAVRCRAAIERYAKQGRQRSLRESLDAALVATIRRPIQPLLVLGTVFVVSSLFAGVVTGDIMGGIHAAVLVGTGVCGGLLITHTERKMYATPRHRRSNARVETDSTDESAESSTHSTPTTTEED